MNNNLIPPQSRQWVENISPIAFKIGSFSVTYYGIFIMIGFSLAILFSVLKLKYKYKISVEPFYYFIFLGVPLAIFGASFWSCCIGDSPWNNLFVFPKAGLAIQGGVMLVVFAACIFVPLVLRLPQYHVRDNFGPTPIVAKCTMWLYFDAVIPTILLGQVIGRWGNYFNQEIYGPIVDDNQAFCTFLHDVLPYMYVAKTGHYHLPLFLIESIINFFGFLTLYIGCEFIKVRKVADLSFLYFVWYGIVRIILEPYRVQEYTFNMSKVITIIWIIISILLIVLNHCFCHKWRKIKIWESIKMLGHRIKNRFKHKNQNNNLPQFQKQKKILVYRSNNERIYYAGM